MRVGRRQFVQGAGGVGLALLAGCGRLPGQVPRPSRVACLGPWTPVSGSSEQFLDALRDHGYEDGQNLVVEFRRNLGLDDALQPLASELLSWQPDVFVTQGTPATKAAIAVTQTLPIVFISVNDPVGQGLVASLARPGRNVTGVSVDPGPGLPGKRLELLRDTRPGLTRVAVLLEATNPANALEWEQTREAAAVLGIEVRRLGVSAPGDLEPALAAAVEWGAEGLMVAPASFLNARAPDIGAFGLEHHLPVVSPYRPAAEAGGLLAYGPNIAGMYRRAADYVDRLLKGVKPADLPVEQPTTFDFIVNLRTAQALGLTIPQHVLAQATELIQ
jgi:putative tryptophan/tyrosine transport system substrate-binding protein